MKDLFVLLTVPCFWHIISTQRDRDPPSGLGHLRSVITGRYVECGNIWVAACLTKEHAIQATGRCQCAPYLEVSSEKDQAVRAGGSITLYCLFFGYPVPTMSWTGPQKSLPAGRYTLFDLGIGLVLNGTTASDEGNYSCKASNNYGNDTRTLHIRVVAAPEFRNMTDGPYNVRVTEGESTTFSCKSFAIPEANIVWLLNEQPIDTDNAPTRFVFSNDSRSLTIRDVCRDCVDQERQTDLMVIQCNASNVHRYAFASGYLNVLLRTTVTIRGPENVSVDFPGQKQFVFQCIVTSDPSTPATVRWYKTEPLGDLVRSDPPFVNVTNEFLIITIEPTCSADCAKYFGEYRCVGDNGYSRDNQTITLPYVGLHRPTPETCNQTEELWEAWKIILVAGAIGHGLLLVGIFIRLRLRRSYSGTDRNSATGRYDSPSPDVHGESIDAPKKEAMGTLGSDRPVLDEGRYV